MLSKVRGLLPVFILIAISILVCALNYAPGTFLSGWDTLHPEFNFGLAFERTISGVFRVEQGLGAVAGHSHMADLPRIVLLYISHFVIPLDFLRYSYIYLCAVFGTVGMYFFLEKHLIKNKTASFLGALFYLLNVGTVQTFNVPFEMFTTLFATIPYLFYFATSYLLEVKQRTRHLVLFALFSVLNAPSAYAATLWYVFLGCFIVYFLSLAIVDRQKDKHYFKHFAVLLGVFVGTNLFWLIPNIYFIVNHAKEVANANINLLFSDQAFLKNKEFGNLADILLLKSFYFDWSIYGGAGHFTDLLAPWIAHFKDVKVLLVSFLFGFGYILGSVYSYKVLGKKSIPLFLTLLVSLLFLINNNFPLGPIYSFFQGHVPFFKEAFRFPDDKILNVYVFLVSIFFAFACLFILSKIEKLGKKNHFGLVFAGLVTMLIVFYSLPTFSGNFINKYMRVTIPKYYFSMFDYLKTKPTSDRVANLPINSPWGWVYYDWKDGMPDYQGAGFLYFGIQQPLLDRDFDRWSPYNESYYREMSYAIYSQNASLLTNVLKKYNIATLFIDKSVSDPQNPSSVLFFDQSKALLKKTGLIKNELQFGTVDLFNLKSGQKDISSVDTSSNVNPSTTTTYEDYAYSSVGDYVTSINEADLTNVAYPFRDLIDNQSKLHPEIVSLDSEKITLNPRQKVSGFSSSNLLPNLTEIPSDLIAKKVGSTLSLSIYPNTPVFDNTPSASYLTGNIPLSHFSNIYVSVNENELFPVGNIADNTPFAIGKINLQTKNNDISVFDSSQINPISNTVKIINPFFSSCKGDNDAPVSGFTENGMKLTGKGDICILIPYGFFPKEGAGKLLTNFQFEFSGNAKITSCLFSQETSQCLYYQNPVRSGNIVSFPYAMDYDKTGKRAIKIFIQNDNDKNQTYNLVDLSTWYSKSIGNFPISADILTKTFQTKNLSFNKIYLPKNIVYDPGFSVATLNKLSNDCKFASLNTVKKLVTKDNLKTSEYSSDIGSFCDHFSYQNLSHNQGYLIVVNSKNENGLPLTLCVTNYTTRKCDIYSYLGENKSFANDIFLLPPTDKDGIGYDINLENLGVKGSPSVNFLSSIEFIPIPYQFLLNINTKSQATLGFEGKVEQFSKVSPLFYLVKTNGQPTVINLNLSYEKGFRAYNLDCSQGLACIIKAFFAPLFEQDLGSHVLVNNWSNGWILNPNQSQIAVIYVPQYFEYIGLLLIVFIFASITIHHKTKAH